MAIGGSLRFNAAMVLASPVEAAFGVGEDGCSAVVAVAGEREAAKQRVGNGGWRGMVVVCGLESRDGGGDGGRKG
nr:hypothetical protein Iba_chr08dCG10290 [Ipomoea batatas]